jgi:hypothetical protein
VAEAAAAAARGEGAGDAAAASAVSWRWWRLHRCRCRCRCRRTWRLLVRDRGLPRVGGVARLAGLLERRVIVELAIGLLAIVRVTAHALLGSAVEDGGLAVVTREAISGRVLSGQRPRVRALAHLERRPPLLAVAHGARQRFLARMIARPVVILDMAIGAALGFRLAMRRRARLAARERGQEDEPCNERASAHG